MYGCLLGLSDCSFDRIKRVWEGELGESFEEDWWASALDRIRSSTICARLGLIQFKVLYRIHFSKARLLEIFPNVEDRCDRCHAPLCNLSHMFFTCPMLQNYWVSYFTTMSKVLKIRIDVFPTIAIFGVPKIWSQFNSKQLDVISFTSLLARRRILLHWKSNKPPATSQWLVDTMFFLKLEKVRCSRKSNFFSKWHPFIAYFKSLKTLPPG